MHQFEGDEHGGLLVRLFYPAELGPNPPSSPSHYAPWNPHTRYIKGYLDYTKSKAPELITSITNAFLTPRTPAMYGATVLRIHPPTTSQSSSTAVSEEGVNAESENCGDGVKGAPPDEKQIPKVPSAAPFPVVIFSHGMGGTRFNYSGICCDLASYGYVVAAVEHRDRSACVALKRVSGPGSTPDQPQFQDEWLEFYHKKDTEKEFPLRNGQVLQRGHELTLALDLLTMLSEGVDVVNMMEGSFDFKQFQGKLDIGKAAVMGHSFGGSTTIQALSEDQRFRCGLALDTWMLPIHRNLLETGIQQPLLFINSYNIQKPDNIGLMVKLTHPPGNNGISPCRILTIKDTYHMNQSDEPFVTPEFSQQRWGASRLDPYVAHAVNMDICHAFLRRYLLKDPSFLEPVPNLDGGEGHSEHIIFGTNVDRSEPLEEGQSQPSSTDRAVGQANQSEIETHSQNKGEEISEEKEEEAKTAEGGKNGEKRGEESGRGKEQAEKDATQVEEGTPEERTEGQDRGE